MLRCAAATQRCAMLLLHQGTPAINLDSEQTDAEAGML